MSTRTDYASIIAKTNYGELSKKLDEMAKQEPPKRRKSAADAIAPVAGANQNGSNLYSLLLL